MKQLFSSCLCRPRYAASALLLGCAGLAPAQAAGPAASLSALPAAPFSFAAIYGAQVSEPSGVALSAPGGGELRSPSLTEAADPPTEVLPALLPEAPLRDMSLPEAPSTAWLRDGTRSPEDDPAASNSSSVSYALSGAAQGTATPNIAPRLTKYIPSGMTAQSITAHDKVLIGLRDLYSPLNFLAMVAAAGYEQALNGEPNYGTDRGAFGQRLGAAAIRESSQGLFTDAVFAPLFHEDPRYFVQGSGHNVLYRALYAATRPLITRTDGGHSTVNAALLAGYASSAALSYTYYPPINRNFHDTASTFGGSLGGAALGFVVSEFSDDLLKAVHLRKK